MAPRTSPPFRADHVGSLLRPQRLLQAREDFAAGRISAADLRAEEDLQIPAAITMQEEVGLQSATDGEFRRASWHMDFIYALGGVSKTPGHLAVKFHNAAGDIEFTPASIRVDSKLRINDTIFADAFTFLRSHVTTAVPKLTIPSPNMVHYRGGPASVDQSVYPDMEEFWADLAAAYAGEVRRQHHTAAVRRQAWIAVDQAVLGVGLAAPHREHAEHGGQVLADHRGAQLVEVELVDQGGRQRAGTVDEEATAVLGRDADRAEPRLADEVDRGEGSLGGALALGGAVGDPLEQAVEGGGSGEGMFA